MAEPTMVEVGRVSGYFAQPSVAIVEVGQGASLRVGETIAIKGHTTDFQQTIESMQVEHQPVAQATAGQSVGIKVKDRVRRKDVVYKVG